MYVLGDLSDKYWTNTCGAMLSDAWPNPSPMVSESGILSNIDSSCSEMSESSLSMSYRELKFSILPSASSVFQSLIRFSL